MTTVANPTLGKIEDAIERFGLSALIEVGLAALFAWQPWLSSGGILRYLVGLLADQLFGFIRLSIDLADINFVNSAHQDAFDRAVVKLRIIAHEKGIDSDEFKKGREDAKASFALLVHFNGA